MSGFSLEILIENIVAVLLLEGIVDDLKEKYPNLKKEIDELSSRDPSGKNKYLRWSIKQLDNGYNINDIASSVEYFHKNNKKFKKQDIYQYKNLKNLEDEVKEISQSKPSRSQMKGNAKKVFENKDQVLLYIKDKNASICYGAGTKWCITMRDASYFEQYTEEDGSLFYFLINKNLPPDNPLHKVAFAIFRNETDGSYEGVEIFNAEDDIISLEQVENGEKILSIIKNDAKDKPLPFAVRLETGDYSEKEVIDRYKNSTGNLIRQIIVRNVDPNVLSKLVPYAMGVSSTYIAKHVDPKYLPKLMHHPSASTRLFVAQRIDPKYLPEMINDERAHVRKTVAQRIDPKYLPEMINDDRVEVLEIVVDRIDPEHLPEMAKDIHPYISQIARERMK